MKKHYLYLLLVGAALTGMGVVHAAPTILIDQGASWNYVTPIGTDLWTNWASAGYASFDWDNASWSTGNAAFGNQYNGLPIVTAWATNTDLALRTTFNLAGSINGNLTLNVASDNGFIVFANGNEVARGNAEGFTSYWEYTLPISASNFVQGQNIISVLAEDHGGITFFDMKLSGDIVAVPAPGAILLGSMGAGLVGWLRRRRSL